MILKEPGACIPIDSISRVSMRGEEGCAILQQGREVPVDLDAPPDVVAVAPAVSDFAISRDKGTQGFIADPVVAWRVGPMKAHPVGLRDREQNRDDIETPGRLRALKLPDRSVLYDSERVYDCVDAWLTANGRAPSGSV